MSSQCPICFEKANYTTACNHSFCKRCLYYWKKTCPLCRSRIQPLQYPNTRAMARRDAVCARACRLLRDIARTKKRAYKIKYAEKLLNYIWDNRIIIRKYNRLCKVIQQKSVTLKSEYRAMGILPPKILNKTMTI